MAFLTVSLYSPDSPLPVYTPSCVCSADLCSHLFFFFFIIICCLPPALYEGYKLQQMPGLISCSVQLFLDLVPTLRT